MTDFIVTEFSELSHVSLSSGYFLCVYVSSLSRVSFIMFCLFLCYLKDLFSPLNFTLYFISLLLFYFYISFVFRLGLYSLSLHHLQSFFLSFFLIFLYSLSQSTYLFQYSPTLPLPFFLSLSVFSLCKQPLLSADPHPALPHPFSPSPICQPTSRPTSPILPIPYLPTHIPPYLTQSPHPLSADPHPALPHPFSPSPICRPTSRPTSPILPIPYLPTHFPPYLTHSPYPLSSIYPAIINITKQGVKYVTSHLIDYTTIRNVLRATIWKSTLCTRRSGL